MGLDQYLRAKTKLLDSKRSRGACGGLFPVGPADNGTTEIGYWRKAYRVSDYLRETLKIKGAFNLKDKKVSYKQVCSIIDYSKAMLEEDDNSLDEYEKEDWKDTVSAFTKAKEILDADKEAKIFYMEWY